MLTGLYGAFRRGMDRNSYVVVPLAIAAALLIANVAVRSASLAPSNWATSLMVMCPLVLTGIAEAPPVLSGRGGMDLSVGPFAGFVTTFIAGLLVPAGITAPEVLVPLVLGLGLVAGAVNGVLIAYIRLPAIIVTLGGYLFYSGLASVVLPAPGGTVPSWLVGIDASYGPIPGILFVFAAVALAWTLISKTAYTRNLLAVGGDDRTAYAAGVNVAAIRLWAYVFAGLFAALAGLLLSGLLQSGDATVGPPYTIAAFTAVALGGISLAGGRGGLLGAAVGGVILFLIQTLLTSSGFSVYEMNIANGAMLIGALGLNSVVGRLRKRDYGRPALAKPATLAAKSPRAPLMLPGVR